MTGYMRHLHKGPCPPRCRDPAKWEVRVYLGVDPASGKKRYLSRTAPSKRAAERLRAELVAQHSGHAGGRRLAPADATVEALLWRWLDHARPEMSPSSVDAAETHIRLYLAPLLGRVKVDRLSGEQISACYDHLRRHGGMCQPCRRRARAGQPPLGPGVEVRLWRRTVVRSTDCAAGLPLSPTYVRRIHATLHAALTYARVTLKWVGANPADDLERARRQTRRRRITPPTAEEVARLLAAAAEGDFEFFCWLLLDAVTGARRGEVVAVRASRVDWARGTVLFSHAIVHGRDPISGARCLQEKQTKQDRPKELAVDPLTLKLLTQVRGRQQERALAAGVSWPHDAYLFSPDLAGRVPYRPDGMTKRFMRLRARLGLERVRLHDLRHHAASAMLRGGIDVVRAAARTGHDPATMLRHYGHYVGGDAEAATLLANLFSIERLPAVSGEG
jgi:integrase